MKTAREWAQSAADAILALDLDSSDPLLCQSRVLDAIAEAVAAARAEEREAIAIIIGNAILDGKPLKGRDALAFAIRARKP